MHIHSPDKSLSLNFFLNRVLSVNESSTMTLEIKISWITYLKNILNFPFFVIEMFLIWYLKQAQTKRKL